MRNPQSQLEALVKFFTKPEAKKALRDSIIETFTWARDVVEKNVAYDEEQECPRKEASISKELRDTALDNFTYCRYHHDLVREAVRTIPSPAVVSEADIRSLIESTLVVDPEDHDFDETYGSFLDSLTGAISKFEQRIRIFLVGAGIPWQLDRKSPFQWSSDAGFQLRIPALETPIAPPPPHPWGYPEGRPTFGSIEALATEDAFNSGSRTCATVTCAIVQMMRLAGCWQESKPRSMVSSLIHKTEPHELVILRSALDTYFVTPPSGDTTEGRLANGLHLWCLAEGQTRPGLRISLAVASIEAMLGEKGEGIGRVLGERVAVLLCTEPDSRNFMAKFVRKDLYALRSKVLHGSDLKDSIDVKRVEHALRLAALVFRAYWEHHNFMKRLPNAEDPRDFFSTLEDQKWSGKSVVVLPESVSEAAMALCAEISRSDK